MRKPLSKARGKRRKKPTASPGNVRLTPQRKAVLEALSGSCEHPTARELYELTKRLIPGISLATIYNSLQTLQRAGLVNEHHLTSGAARYCINKTPHVHLLDENTGRMLDIRLREGVRPEEVFDLPAGTTISSMRAYLYGKIHKL